MRQAHVEHLSQSDKTNLSKSMFMNNTNLLLIANPRTCSSPCHISQALLEVHCFRIFRARSGEKFFTHVLEMGTNHVRDALDQHHF